MIRRAIGWMFPARPDLLEELAGTTSNGLQLRALSLFGLKNRMSKLPGKLALLQ